MRSDIYHRRNESGDIMDDGSGRHQGVSGLLVSGTHSVQTNESKNMGEEKNIPIWNKKYTAYVKLTHYICNMLREVQKKI